MLMFMIWKGGMLKLRLNEYVMVVAKSLLHHVTSYAMAAGLFHVCLNTQSIPEKIYIILY